MHEPVLVGGVEGRGHAVGDRQRAGRLEGALAAQQRAQVGAVDVAHDQVQPSVDLAGVVDGDDVRVVEARGEARLPQQPLAEGGVVGALRGEQLDGHVASEALVVRPEHLAHAAAADARIDAVAGELVAGAQGPARRHAREPTPMAMR